MNVTPELISDSKLSNGKFRYAVTVRKTRKPMIIDSYFDYLDALSDHCTILNVNFEETRGLHVHFTCESNRPMVYSDFIFTKYGWNVKFVPIYNLHGWFKYCRKDAHLYVSKQMRAKYKHYFSNKYRLFDPVKKLIIPPVSLPFVSQSIIDFQIYDIHGKTKTTGTLVKSSMDEIQGTEQSRKDSSEEANTLSVREQVYND